MSELALSLSDVDQRILQAYSDVFGCDNFTRGFCEYLTVGGVKCVWHFYDTSKPYAAETQPQDLYSDDIAAGNKVLVFRGEQFIVDDSFVGHFIVCYNDGGLIRVFDPYDYHQYNEQPHSLCQTFAMLFCLPDVLHHMPHEVRLEDMTTVSIAVVCMRMWLSFVEVQPFLLELMYTCFQDLEIELDGVVDALSLWQLFAHVAQPEVVADWFEFDDPIFFIDEDVTI